MCFADTNSDGAAEILEESHYYAFGSRIEGLSSSNIKNKFTYNGKELEDDFNLNWYHYGARYYDGQLGRWWTIDPADECHSPYEYVSNRPTVAIDPSGDDTYLIIVGSSKTATNLSGDAAHDVGNTFKKVAEAYKAEIEARPGYDSKRDHVYVVDATVKSELYTALNTQYEHGLISEVAVFAHSYGPLGEGNGLGGGLNLGGEDKGSYINKTVSIENLLGLDDFTGLPLSEGSPINISNFSPNASILLGGCNAGTSGYGHKSFAQEIANNFGVTVRAFNGPTRANNPLNPTMMIGETSSVNLQTFTPEDIAK